MSQNNARNAFKKSNEVVTCKIHPGMTAQR